MKRDRRLMIALLFFIVTLIMGTIQALILRAYVTAAVLGDWTYFAETFSVDPPVGPNQVCFDYCAADLPFMAGWVGVGTFVAGSVTLAYAWWKPRA